MNVANPVNCGKLCNGRTDNPQPSQTRCLEGSTTRSKDRTLKRVEMPGIQSQKFTRCELDYEIVLTCMVTYSSLKKAVQI